MSGKSHVTNNEEEGRYELSTHAGVAVAAYERRAGALVFTHTEVPEAAAGQGVGKHLIAGALADARALGLKVVPLCGFVSAYFDEHPDDQDLLAVEAPG